MIDGKGSMGASVPDQALVNHAPAGHGAPRFDPSRVAWLHIRPQFTYHAEAEIVGSKDGLMALQRAVSFALGEGEGEETACASDGEGYVLKVRCSRTKSGLGEPTYLDELARNLAYHERDYLVRESKLVRKQTEEAYNALRWCRANGNPHTSGMSAEGRDGEASSGPQDRQPGPEGETPNPTQGNNQ